MVERKRGASQEHKYNLFTGEHISPLPAKMVVHSILHGHEEVVGCTDRSYVALDHSRRLEAQGVHAGLLLLRDPTPRPKRIHYREYAAHIAQVFGEPLAPIMVGMCVYGEDSARGYDMKTHRLVSSASFVFKGKEESSVHTIIGTILHDEERGEVFRWRYHKEYEPFSTANGVWLPSVQAIRLAHSPQIAHIPEDSLAHPITNERREQKERKLVIENEIHAGQIAYLLQEVEKQCLPVKLPASKR